MTKNPSSHRQSRVRRFLALAFTVSALTVALSLSPFFSAGVVSAIAADTSETTLSLASKNTISTYKWNLADRDLPLINLPDRLSAGVGPGGRFRPPRRASALQSPAPGLVPARRRAAHGQGSRATTRGRAGSSPVETPGNGTRRSS